MVQELIRNVGGERMMFVSSRFLFLSLFEDNFGLQFPVCAVSIPRVLLPTVESLSIAPIDSGDSASVRDPQSQGGVWACCFGGIPETDWQLMVALV
jgi:hypothetical protein